MKTIIAVVLAFNISLIWAQEISITVIDEQTSETIPYANVLLLGTQIGTVTKGDGVFRIDLAEYETKGDSLHISVVGYSPKKVALRKLHDGATIRISPRHVSLEAALIKPKSPEEYIQMAIKEIPANYSDEAFNGTIYFRSNIMLNGKFLESSEAIIKGYIMPVVSGIKDSTRLKMLAFKHFEERDEAINSIRKGKKKDKMAMKGLDSTLLKLTEEINRHFGIYTQIDSNFVKQLHLKGFKMKGGKFWFENMVRKGDRNIMKIGFSEKEGMANQKGVILLDEESLAIEACNYELASSSLKLRLLLWVFGIGFNQAEAIVQLTSRKEGNKWIPDLMNIYLFIDVEKNRWFAKDIPIVMQFSSHVSFLETHSPADDLCNEGQLIQKRKMLEEQFVSNPESMLWLRYRDEIEVAGKAR